MKEDKMSKACSMNVGRRNAYIILEGKREGKRQLRGPSQILVDNIDLAQNRDQWRAVVDTVTNLQVQ
jgi:hypothetical protein